ncbi:unnamed protein product [Heligmosomoides polygyrus]|uniref:Uncharacterized protein n=1 Tax=Heligmosomoides polygyrus TaxID=6339 RepID=A0A3P8DX86_HELPZ|nr:unnamed protein product [Heligmosomoides polygyrus]
MFPPNVSMCEGFGFACTSQPSVVISTSLRCDGKSDCPDGSDEFNCRECQSAFSCSMSSKSKVKVCLRAEQLCDGVAHCPDDYDEEKHCSNFKGTWNTYAILEDSCDDDEFKCPSTSLCLPPTSICDGIVDCDSEDDEKDCKECTRGALCSDGTCLDRSRVCDGITDCSDGVDEEDCPGSCILDETVKIPYITCADGRRYPQAEACSGVIEQCSYNCTKCDGELAFTCSDKKCIPRMLVWFHIGVFLRISTMPRSSTHCIPKCIPKAKVCDGVWDCLDGKDETNCHTCPSNSIRCPGEQKCIPKISRCDGVADCRDGSDETDCTCEECVGSHWNTYMCGATSHCFRRDEVCAPYTLCPNATKADKVFCAGRALRGMDWES